MTRTRVRVLGFVVAVMAAAQLGGSAVQPAQARGITAQCPAEGNSNHCVYNACNQSYNDQIWACLGGVGEQFNENCCADVVSCNANACWGGDEDVLECTFWTFDNGANYCPYLPAR